MCLFDNKGEIPERSKGADCKSAGSAFVGSNPTLATIGETCAGYVCVWYARLSGAVIFERSAGIAQLVERQPSKL